MLQMYIFGAAPHQLWHRFLQVLLLLLEIELEVVLLGRALRTLCAVCCVMCAVCMFLDPQCSLRVVFVCVCVSAVCGVSVLRVPCNVM